MSSSSLKPVFAVFDFDWSFINDNVDTFIFEQLIGDKFKDVRTEMEKKQEKTTETLCWTDLIDHGFQILETCFYDINNPSNYIDQNKNLSLEFFSK